jgi:hypothetical protein
MFLKIAAGVLAVALMLIYLAPVVLKLKEPALTIVVAMGVIMMLVDLWQSFKAKDE